MGIVEILLLVLLLAAVAVVLVVWRRLRLLRQGGIDVAVRYGTDKGGRWHIGVGRYRGDEFTWFRALGLRSGPDQVFNRVDLEIDSRREPTGPETYMVPSGSTVLCCQSASGDFELAMPPGALTGFLSWLESTPPGRSVPWAS
ncbi:DUF2550 domain-containing protein [Allokutzneria multivorans]|uniref:DUF2550 domain-containing protein n=1 Tax=Allokutzneria multivorans TaxID=1142134 RepID=A0ABP7TPK0_9PSEU